MSESEISKAKISSSNKNESDNKQNRLDGKWVRKNIRKPNKALLLLYYLDPSVVDYTDRKTPIVGFAISFPGSDSDDAESYMVHRQLLPQFNIEDDVENNNNDED